MHVSVRGDLYGGGDASAGGLATKRFMRKGWWEFYVLDRSFSMDTIVAKIMDVHRVFVLSRCFGQGSVFLLPSLFCSPAWFPTRLPSVTEHILSTMLTASHCLTDRLSHPHIPQHYLSFIAPMRTDTYHRTRLPVILPDPPSPSCYSS